MPTFDIIVFAYPMLNNGRDCFTGRLFTQVNESWQARKHCWPPQTTS